MKATIREADRVAVVALKLKGAAGSFREWDDRPALTLNMHKFNKGGTFHGLVKFHLNNSVQDETYLHELLCSELFRRAGIPAPRVTRAGSGSMTATSACMCSARDSIAPT